MLSFTRLASLASLCALATAEPVTIRSTLGQRSGAAEIWTCDTGVDNFTFDFTPLMLGEYSLYYDAICGYPPATGMLLTCAVDLADDQSSQYREKIFKYAAKACKQYSSFHYPWTYYEDQWQNATAEYVPLDSIDNTSLPIYVATTPNITALKPEYIGYKAYYFNLDSGTWFSVGICGYFLLLIIISAIYNFSRSTSISKTINNSALVKLSQKYIIFPTLFPNGKFSQVYGWKYLSFLFPNRIQFITDLFLFALQVAFYCVNYRYKQGWWFGTPEYAWHRYIGDRTGIMAFGKIPLLVLFAGRNNFLLSITGWSYSTFLHFHKIVAYWMFLDALIHSVAYTIYSLGYYVEYLKDTYFACGVAATVLCGVILLQAFHPFRVHFYEYFLTIHVILAIAFIIMCWYHCNTLGWLEWLIAACSVWFFDRVMRVSRMFAFGSRAATISIVGDNLFKVEVPKPAWWHHQPGTFSYVYFAGWIFWENHPFTTVVEGDNLCAYIKVKKGVTLRVWNKLLKNNNTLKWKVSFEGPYGGSGSRRLNKYDDTLLIAGGSGVPSILENAAAVRKGKMVWITQTLDSAKAYQPLIEKIKTELIIYVTREQNADRQCSISELFNDADSSTENSEKESDSGKVNFVSSSSQITICYSKPNIHDILDGAVRDADGSNIGIMACGPPRLMDEIRNVVANGTTQWSKSIDYFDEFQIW